MASKVQDKHGNFLVAFRFGGRQFTRSLDTRDEEVADAGVARVDEALLRLKRGWLTMPEGADAGTFIVSGGQLTGKSVVESRKSTTPAPPQTIASLLARYADDLTPDSKSPNTLNTETIHRQHLTTHLGMVDVAAFGLTNLDAYIKARSPRDVVTIKKEIATLRMIWNWGHKRGHVTTPWSWMMKDLKFPKTTESEPFRTWQQIEQRITPKTTPEQVKALWECLFLDESQIQECLIWVQANARQRFIFPMFTFAAYTGARRGEILRSERNDFDFKNRTVAIRQTKGDTSKDFTLRNVRLHPTLIEVMQKWFADHPGGRYTITDGRDEPMNPRMMTKYFRQTVAGRLRHDGRFGKMKAW